MAQQRDVDEAKLMEMQSRVQVRVLGMQLLRNEANCPRFWILVSRVVSLGVTPSISHATAFRVDRLPS